MYQNVHIDEPHILIYIHTRSDICISIFCHSKKEYITVKKFIGLDLDGLQEVRIYNKQMYPICALQSYINYIYIYCIFHIF